jgi:hypothetical protein
VIRRAKILFVAERVPKVEVGVQSTIAESALFFIAPTPHSNAKLFLINYAVILSLREK